MEGGSSSSRTFCTVDPPIVCRADLIGGGDSEICSSMPTTTPAFFFTGISHTLEG